MTKKEMCKQIAERFGISQLLAQEAVQLVFEGSIETLVGEGRIELRDFGVFEVKRRRARNGRNPRTGESVAVPERMIVTFKQGMEIGQRVNELAGSLGR